MTEMDRLREAARIAGTVAGLTENQIPGLAELFRLAWLEGAKAQQREDADRCDREATRWAQFLADRAADYPEGSVDRANVEGCQLTAAIMAGAIRNRRADPDEEPEPPAAAEPPPSMPKPQKRSPARSRRPGGGTR